MDGMPRTEELLRVLRPPAREAYEIFDRLLIDGGATPDYVAKTIYVTYMIRDEIVAAVYPHPQYFEVALALPEDHPSPLLDDATHLTWRTLPVSLKLHDKHAAVEASELILEALERVATNVHNVVRNNDHFMSRTKRPGLGSKG